MSNESNQTDTTRELARPNRQPEGPPARQPVRDLPDRPPVRSTPVQTAPRPVHVRRTQEEKSSNLGEYVKFGLLATILLGTPVIVALLIPLIFGHIVPAILGSNLPAETPAIPGEQVVEPDTAGTPGVVSPGDPETGIGGESTPVPATTDVLVHLVRSGDTLATIARQYGVTAADIAAANNITDPNEIFVGTILIIPQPTNP